MEMRKRRFRRSLHAKTSSRQEVENKTIWKFPLPFHAQASGASRQTSPVSPRRSRQTTSAFLPALLADSRSRFRQARVVPELFEVYRLRQPRSGLLCHGETLYCSRRAGHAQIEKCSRTSVWWATTHTQTLADASWALSTILQSALAGVLSATTRVVLGVRTPLKAKPCIVLKYPTCAHFVKKC